MSEIINCGNLKIRTPQNSASKTPNTITQSVSKIGMKIGFVVDYDLSNNFKFDLIVKDSLNVILYNTITPLIYNSIDSYVYFVIPTNLIPSIGSTINIKILLQNSCTFDVDYTILTYNTTTGTSSTTVANGLSPVEKYIKIKPNTNSAGFDSNKDYYFKCSSNKVTDTECFAEFLVNDDLSKIYEKLPDNSTLVECPPPLRWILQDTICLTVGSTSSTSTVKPKPICPTDLTLDNVVYVSGNNYKISFTSTGVSSITWKLLNSNNVQVSTGNSGELTASTFTADFGNLYNGIYVLKINADNCSSSEINGTRSFTVSNGQISSTSSSSTTQNSGNNCPITINSIVRTSGTNSYSIAYTSTNLSSATVSLATSSSPNVAVFSQNMNISTNPFTVNLGERGNGDYILKIKATNCNGEATKAMTITSDGVITPSDGFTNLLKSLPYETTNNSYNPNYFPKIGVTLSNNPVLNRPFPNYMITWKVEGTIFKRYNIHPNDIGISFMHDFDDDGAYDGIGKRCIDFILETNPDTGQAWVGNIDTACNKTWLEFVSSIPFEHRAFSLFGATNSWANVTEQQTYELGTEASASRRFGWGDRANGKVNVGLIEGDVENGTEDGSSKHLSFLIGGAESTQGFFFSQYSSPFKPIDIDPSMYEDENGNRPLYAKNVFGQDRYDTSINAYSPNYIPRISDWNHTNKITVAGKFTNKGVIDYSNLVPCQEVSFSNDMSKRHGGSAGYKTVNKFGENYNTLHPIAYLIFSGDVNKHWCVTRLNNRQSFLQSKIICDRNDLGNPIQGRGVGSGWDDTHFDRSYSFMIGAMTAMTGHHWQIWDRLTTTYKDGYNGAFAWINLINQRKKFGSENKSFNDLFYDFKFLLEKSQISYDGGSTYSGEQAQKYVLDKLKIPQRQALTDSGYWTGILVRPERTERTSCKLKVTWQGKDYFHTVSPNMWETTNPTHSTKQLSDIPDIDKEFYYFLFKLNGAGGEVGNDNFYISSSTSPVLNGTSVTFTAFNCGGTVTWKSNGTDVGTGNTLTRTMGVNETITAQCSNGLVSNSITSSESTTDVFLFIGESNMGTRNLLDTAQSGELGLKESNVRILNNDSMILETLNMSSNSSLGENDCIPNTTWGLELPAYQFFKAGGTGKNELVIGKLAQGGATIGQFNEDFSGGYFPIIKARIDKIKQLLTLEGKTPKFHIFYSQGINNVIAGESLYDDAHFPNLRGSLYWREATKVLIDKLLLMTGSNTKIVMTKFFNSYKGNFGTYLNSRIDELVSWKSSNILTVDTTDLTLSDGLHFDAPSTKVLFNRMAQKHFGTSITTLAPNPPSNGNVVITEPNRVANYYKSSNGQAGIISRYLLNFDDNVYLENSYMKVGISLRGGGAIVHLSKAGSTVNLVNNDDDGGIGRQIQPDYYQKPETFSIEGKTLSSYFPRNGYNTTLGGDDFKNVPTLLDYYSTTDGYYVKFKPLIWGIDGHISEITMEVLYKLEGNALKVSYTYTSERTDSQIVVPQAGEMIIDGISVPTLHMNKFFTKIHGYGTTGEGQSPHVINDFLPTNIPNVVNRQFSNIETNEGWVAIEAPSQNTILGVINKKCGYIRSERKNVVDENLGGTGEDATTIVELTQSPQNIDYRLKQVRKDDAYLIFGTVDQIRTKALSV